VPSLTVQGALLRAYVEYVHPYMPLLDLHEFLSIVDARDGSRGQTSLFLYQAVMFCATAFVSNKIVKEAGYASRKAARRAFFTKARVRTEHDSFRAAFSEYLHPISSCMISTMKMTAFCSSRAFS